MFASLNRKAFLNFTKFLCSASFKRVLQIYYHSIWGQSHQAALQFSAMFGLHHKRWVSPSLSLLVISILSASFVSLWSWTIVCKSSFLSVLFITFCSLYSKLEVVEAVSCTKTSSGIGAGIPITSYGHLQDPSLLAPSKPLLYLSKWSVSFSLRKE